MDNNESNPSGICNDLKWKEDSKRLCRFLRHRPDSIAIDEYGWASVSEIAHHGILPEGRIRELAVASRFELSDDGTRIRAYHGHSFPVIYEPAIPPETLYHGTTEECYAAILKSESILPMKRYRVHLSADPRYALEIGRRHGKHPIVLAVDAGRMSRNGIGFCLSGDGIYLCESVPIEYVHVLDVDIDPPTVALRIRQTMSAMTHETTSAMTKLCSSKPKLIPKIKSILSLYLPLSIKY